MIRVRDLVRYAALALLVACAPAGDVGLDPAPLTVGAAGPHRMNWLVLSVQGPAEGQSRATFAGQGAGRISVGFLPQGRGAYGVVTQCDGRARVRMPEGETSAPMWVRAGDPVSLRVEPGERAQILLDLHPETVNCTLSVTPGGRAGWTLALTREDHARPDLAALDAPLPACAPGGGDALERAFMGDFGLSASCPMPLGAYRLLPDGIDALNARIEALTGRPMSRAALEAGDPEMPIDFSTAPDLDLIYLTYLNLNADFSGVLLARMLEWHAARGTAVRILVSQVMLTATDRRLFEGLAARYPTVQMQPFQMPASAAHGVDGQLGRFHRVTHVKLFATLARQPGRSVAIVGGRNIHEGYFFPTHRDLRAHPDLHQYAQAGNRMVGGFTSYQDYEIALHEDRAVRRVAAHIAGLWLRDHDTQGMRAPGPGRDPTPPREGTMRHFISIPFADGQAQEEYYAGLFDAARHSIRIASPYLNLPPRLDAALARARARGVRVEVVTTVRVREATDFLVTGLNREFANQHADWLAYYDYDPYPLLLHAKLIVIDSRLTVIGSTNLNQRSFVHDLENGVVVLDRALARRVEATLQQWMQAANRVRPGQPVSSLGALLMRWGAFRRAF